MTSWKHLGNCPSQVHPKTGRERYHHLSEICESGGWGFNKNGATRGMSEMCVYFMGNLLKYVVLNQQMGIYIRGEN